MTAAVSIGLNETRRERVPLNRACLALGRTRDVLIRQIMVGEVPGGQHEGKWFVYADALATLLADR